MKCDISVCIPVYNQGRFVRTAIESCLAQSERPYEIIVSDNWSTDETARVLDSYKSVTKIEIIRPPCHLSIEKHHRFLISATTGTHIAFLYGDDAYAPDFIRTTRRILLNETELGFLAAGSFWCNNAMQPFSIQGLSYPRRVLLPPFGFQRMVGGCGYTISATVWLAESLRKIPPLPEDAALGFDWYYALYVGANHRVKFVPYPLHYYRFHRENISHSNLLRWLGHAMCMLEHVITLSDIDPALRAELKPQALRMARSTLDVPTDFGTGLSWYLEAKRIAQRLLANYGGPENQKIKFPSPKASKHVALTRVAKEFIKRQLVPLYDRRPTYLG